MVINVGESGGGVIVQDVAPLGDPEMLWINPSEGGVAYYYTGDKWKKVAPTIYISADFPNDNDGQNGDLWIRYQQ